MKARDIMTENPACCTPDDSIQHAAKLMADNDCGCLPVVEDLESKKLIGTVTDRDLACRCVAEGKSPDTPVREAMSADPSCCGPDDDVKAVERVMAEQQVRRVPVINEKGCCVGMIAQSDLARETDAGPVVKEVSQPTRRPRSESEAGRRPEER